MFTALDPNATPAERVADLDARILDARRVEWNASQMNRAAGVFAAERILKGLYAERDAIVAEHPTADYDGRVIAARRRIAH
jgi:hypothetical protein